MLTAAWWGGLFGQMRYYLFLKPEARPWQGHNPLAAAGMFFMYVLGTVFMICHRLRALRRRARAAKLDLRARSRRG